jgi:hypothetical protein
MLYFKKGKQVPSTWHLMSKDDTIGLNLLINSQKNEMVVLTWTE